MTYRIEVDRDVCMSSGKCVADAPDLFRFDDDEIAEPVPGAPEDLAEPRALDLARACPSGALRVKNADDEEIDLF
ncbi:ferredoxin [Pseudonocardia ailaonensis]|uniref:Ferredoxin n=1 Tax=Pseudonocardia ailaonensis TaxID=367279 RepID=A0ABN2NH71_9PSEU